MIRLPNMRDYVSWVNLRKQSELFLNQWEPEKPFDFYKKDSFQTRVNWAWKNYKLKNVLHVFIFSREKKIIMGGVTLDNIRKGPFQSASLGYWMGEEFANNGFMTEGLKAIIRYANQTLSISRLEAATLPHNAASRRLLEKCGFKYEGVGQSYLQINGRWENHILYSHISDTRRGLAN